MDLQKMIYEIREATGSISDDRRVDSRYIVQVINNNRTTALRGSFSLKPNSNTIGLTQDLPVEIEIVSRSVLPNCPLNCYVMRSKEKIPTLVYEGTLLGWYDVKSADVTYRYFEKVEPERVGYLTFEFNVVYTFLGSDYYLYFLVKNKNLELKCAMFTGIFEDPTEVDSELSNYPLKQNMWAVIKPQIISDILRTPQEDPLNNSEPDRAVYDRPRTRETSEE